MKWIKKILSFAISAAKVLNSTTMLPGACADGGRQRNDKVKTHDDIACLLMWSLIVLFIANDQTGSFSLFLSGIFTSWGITEQHAWRQAITHLTSIIIKIPIYFIIASENIFETFFSEQTKIGKKIDVEEQVEDDGRDSSRLGAALGTGWPSQRWLCPWWV